MKNVVVEDQEILDMTKALTVQNLNRMYQERTDVFEFEKEQIDWKYPKYITVSKNKKYEAMDIHNYNE